MLSHFIIRSIYKLNILISPDTSMERCPLPFLCYSKHLLREKSSKLETLGLTTTNKTYFRCYCSIASYSVSSAAFTSQYFFLNLILSLHFINS